MSVLELRDVTLTRSGHTILNNVSWDTHEGQHWVVMGPNGAGKTTLLRALTGREHIDTGSITVLGTDLSDHALEDLGSVIGVSSSSIAAHLRPGQLVRDIVRTATWGQAVAFGEEYEDIDNQRAQDLLDAFGAGYTIDRRFATLSEGERQRVFLARALMADPEVIILDEPTAGLDLGAREILMGAMTEIISGPHAPQVIIITHHMEEIPAGITHALLMKEGRITAAGPINDVLTGVEVSRVFDIPLNVTHQQGRWFAHAMR